MWQDIVLTLTNFVFLVSLASAVRDQQKPPLSTSIPSPLALYVICVVQISLGLYLTTVITFIVANLWLTLAVQRYRQGKVIIKKMGD